MPNYAFLQVDALQAIVRCTSPPLWDPLLWTGHSLHRYSAVQVLLYTGLSVCRSSVQATEVLPPIPIQVLLYTGPPDLFTGNSLNRSFSLQVPLYIQVLLYTDPPLNRPFFKSLLLCIAPSLHRSYFPHSNQPSFIIVFLFTCALLHRLFLYRFFYVQIFLFIGYSLHNSFSIQVLFHLGSPLYRNFSSQVFLSTGSSVSRLPLLCRFFFITVGPFPRRPFSTQVLLCTGPSLYMFSSVYWGPPLCGSFSMQFPFYTGHLLYRSFFVQVRLYTGLSLYRSSAVKVLLYVDLSGLFSM